MKRSSAVPLFEGIAATTVHTDRLAANVLARSGQRTDRPAIVFVHGNVSSSLFWQPILLALPEDVTAYAVDLRGFGGSETAPVDATRGVRDFSDDVHSVVQALGLGAVHLVGWSMGGGANPGFVTALTEGDISRGNTLGPWAVYKGTYVSTGFTSEHEDTWVESMLTTATGEDNYPGNSMP
ncbi:alpha/beta fold hydrolase [Arthrobacter sp. E3]|uniref:alpha/beta fold hydrolase n=1 Tax=Arthrobacter sp. E3 TaxID=517402 RepID=UPI0032B34FC8